MLKNKKELSNKGGRPKIEQPLNKVIPARFTAFEYKEIMHKSKLLKISNSSYIRSMTLQGSIRNLFTDEEQHAKKQLIGMANNLNQLLKMANTYGVETVIQAVKMHLYEIDKILGRYKNGSNRQ